MSKIKKSAFAVRPAKATLIFVGEDGEPKEDVFVINYRTMSPARTRELQQVQMSDEQKASFAESLATFIHDNPAASVAEILDQINLLLTEQETTRDVAEMLAKIVVSIPNLVEDDGETPAQVDADLLDTTFDWLNLNAIRDAIKEDQNPRQPSSKD